AVRTLVHSILGVVVESGIRPRGMCSGRSAGEEQQSDTEKTAAAKLTTPDHSYPSLEGCPLRPVAPYVFAATLAWRGLDTDALSTSEVGAASSRSRRAVLVHARAFG